MNFWKEKPLQKRQEDALVYLGDKITVHKIKYKDFELLDHLLINHKVLTSYCVNAVHIYFVMERLA